MSDSKHILLVDDHPIIRDSIKLYFANQPDLIVSGEASDGAEGLKLLEAGHFDLVITDISMPVMNGIDFVAEAIVRHPDQKFLVLSMMDEAAQIKKMISLGVHGYLLKTSPKEEILSVIDKVLQGEKYFAGKVYDRIIDNISGKRPKSKLTLEIPLTKREKEVLKLVMKEHTNQEISELLFISTRTVEAHKRNLLEKTGSKTVAGLAIYAIERGLD